MEERNEFIIEIILQMVKDFQSGTKTVGEIAEDLNISKITIYTG